MFFLLLGQVVITIFSEDDQFYQYQVVDKSDTDGITTFNVSSLRINEPRQDVVHL